MNNEGSRRGAEDRKSNDEADGGSPATVHPSSMVHSPPKVRLSSFVRQERRPVGGGGGLDGLVPGWRECTARFHTDPTFNAPIHSILSCSCSCSCSLRIQTAQRPHPAPSARRRSSPRRTPPPCHPNPSSNSRSNDQVSSASRMSAAHCPARQLPGACQSWSADDQRGRRRRRRIGQGQDRPVSSLKDVQEQVELKCSPGCA